MTRPRKKSRRKRDSNPGSSALEADALPLGQGGGPWRSGHVCEGFITSRVTTVRSVKQQTSRTHCGLDRVSRTKEKGREEFSEREGEGGWGGGGEGRRGIEVNPSLPCQYLTMAIRY